MTSRPRLQPFVPVRESFLYDARHAAACCRPWFFLLVQLWYRAQYNGGLVEVSAGQFSEWAGVKRSTVYDWLAEMQGRGGRVAYLELVERGKGGSPSTFRVLNPHLMERLGPGKYAAPWDRNGAQSLSGEPDETPETLSGQPDELSGEPDELYGYSDELSGEPDEVGVPSYSGFENREVKKGETRVRATPPPPDPEPDPEPDPAPAPNSPPIGQSNGHRNGHGPAVAETPRQARGQTVSLAGTNPVPAEPDPPPEVLDFGEAWDRFTDVTNVLTANLRPEKRTAFAQAFALCNHPEPFRVACKRTEDRLRGAAHGSWTYRKRFDDALDDWTHAIGEWQAKKNTQREAPRVVAAEDEFARFWGNGSQQDDGGE